MNAKKKDTNITMENRIILNYPDNVDEAIDNKNSIYPLHKKN